MTKERPRVNEPVKLKTQAFRLPSNKQRVAVMGRTGSGKTQFGAWLLSQAGFDRQPYIIVDYKIDELLNASDRIQEIGLNEVPRKPGLYIIHPLPSEGEEVDAWLWKIWERERVGLYIDEGYRVPTDGAFDAIMQTGRSKHIPAIILTQRPTWISRFVFSEADFYVAFHLQDLRDRVTAQQFMPAGTLLRGKEIVRIPEFHSKWYDVGSDRLFTLKPVPDAETILDVIDTRLSPKRRTI
jgi:hypothetical protein